MNRIARIAPVLALAAAFVPHPALAEEPTPAPVTEIKPAAPAAEDPPKPEFDPNATGPDKVVVGPAEPQIVEGQAQILPVEMKKVAFIGVVTAPMGDGANAANNLPEGVGLRVMQVMPDTPAQKAGLQIGDVMHKFDDQLLVNSEQLRTLVRTHKPGDEITLTVLRGEKPVQIKATLVEREVPVQEQAFQVVPGALNQPLQWRQIHVGPGGVVEVQPFDPAAGNVDPQIDEVRKQIQAQQLQMLRQLQELRRVEGNAVPPMPLPGGPAAGFNAQASATAVMSDDEHSIRYSVTNGKKQLTAKDKAGNVLYDGPVNTPEERAKVPDAVRAKFEKLEKQMNVNIRVMPDPFAPAPAPEKDDAVLG